MKTTRCIWAAGCLLLWLAHAFCRADAPQAADSLLTDIGISQDTAWQISQPTRAMLDNVNKCRGSYLRTEIRRTESHKLLVVNLAIQPKSRQPSLQLSVQEEQEITEVRVYETLLRTFTAKEGGEKNSYDYHVVPDEVTYGEESTRTIRMLPAPLRNTQVKVNAVSYTTDDDGVLQDPEMHLRMLEALDALDRRTMEFLIEAPGMPSCTYVVYRTMPQRSDFDEKLLDEPLQQDILLAYRLNFRQSLHQPEQDGLEFSLETAPPAVVRTGELFPVTVKVTNHGGRQTSCLLGRTFSRLGDLNGRLFYFGAVEPGNTARFTRYFKVNDGELVNHAFLDIRFSDSWGVLKSRLALDFPLIHSR